MNDKYLLFYIIIQFFNVESDVILKQFFYVN